MATLNLSANGPSITKSYQSVVNAASSGQSASSPTFGQWAVFSVQAPLASAFQNDSGKESVLKVQTTGDGELADFIEEFSDGRIQFGFVKVKDPNTTLPKCVLVAWCGEGVPERTKGYFGSHLTAVAKLLHGYHVQVTARSDSDLTPEGIVQKVADASGSKYSGGGAPTSGGPPPPVASKPKPVFTPTRVGGGSSGFNPLGRSRGPQPSNDDADGWGSDAPPVREREIGLDKVESAYKPTKVNMAELTSQKQQPSRFAPARNENGSGTPDVVKGAYQPIGKVDIAAIRKQAQESGSAKDDRPTIVKGAYEPVGKVDIAAIRARAQAPGAAPSPPQMSPAVTGDEQPKSLADRSAAFNQSERLTSLPKPKVANKFGGSSSFAGTKAPAPGGFQAKPLAAAAPVGTASKTFADEGGKTPAQIWAEKKARERGSSIGNTAAPAPTSPVSAQRSGAGGGWQSGYTGKSWAPVHTTRTGQSATSDLSAQRTGQQDEAQQDIPSSPAGGVGSIRDRFAGAAPMGAPAADSGAPPPPPMDLASKPNAGIRGAPIPGLPTRPTAEEEVPEEETQHVPPPPAVPRSPTPPSPEPQGSPVRIAMPVARGPEPAEIEPTHEEEAPAMPQRSLEKAISAHREPEEEEQDMGRHAGEAAAEQTFGAGASGAAPGGKRAVVQYDYEKAEENEIELVEGQYVTDIDMVDDDWWMGRNEKGETGLFPSNYVELVEDEAPPAMAARPAAAPAAAPAPAPPAAAPPAASRGPTATAQYDYEAAEENELSFPDGATITNLEYPDEDWWYGHFNGKEGLFPANYVTLDE
ncbi:hypothetical protein K402DRAFT_443544 [Aulographum hederae CBS 113979]|uniref:Actin binding protein-like protein n=1 Tax=Aulographum hederae CBS 113979 TaxID=1176131 RepID=A0A6G1HGL0_9PEZI|nr:hypothetical protein K402DRAFT_443544 [Aulographum hederae CBS 113979]